MLIPQKLYGVIGWPLAQSLSPLLHNFAFQKLDLPSAYMAWPVQPQDLAEFIKSASLFNVFGLSVTIPHKIAAFDLVDEISETAHGAGAINTIAWKDGKLIGENTDVAGFLAPLKNIDAPKMDILVLGAGGAAAAAVFALKSLGCSKVKIASPGGKSQFELAKKFGFEPILWQNRYDFEFSFVINATPLGMKGKYENETAFEFNKISKPALAFAYDLVYNPLSTVFIHSAASCGWQIVSGAEMFYWQASAQFELWTGRRFPSETRDVLENALK